ncbi:hypothetical protein YA0745_27700 [Pseudomonas synxantha]|uniref:Uncharacterized protein n=1 Tax=Pseudomonas synxantha TaxID=47883 RepID=A0ABS0UHW0_9PSED|nr:DUF6236 family protein [Pseudomonas synxantha]MBI6565169.1 hypothetical protein [Pseudomonas synxantha]MBI6579883.1 hypothetical protein [Pseudomonas synxantha]MBI6646705.1 hypothetical protein [Pseudomonas synxantha]
MGEARLRKQQDPNYGKPRKDTLRGLIISAPTTISGSSIRIESSSLNQQELRTSLLYWDRLSMPTSNLIHVAPDQDTQFLIDAGILYTPRYTLTGEFSVALAQLPTTALMEYEKKQKGMWSLGGGENSILVKNGFSMPDYGTSLTLYNSLPAPAPSVPLAEILDFRQKRRDELLALRSHIELLTREIESSSDREDELNRKLSDIDNSCSALATVCREWQFPVVLTNLKASLNFNLTKVTGAAVGTWVAAGQLMLPNTARIISAGGAALASMIDIKSDINLRGINRPASPFRYIYEAQKNLI